MARDRTNAGGLIEAKTDECVERSTRKMICSVVWTKKRKLFEGSKK